LIPKREGPGKGIQNREGAPEDVFAAARAGLNITDALERLGKETSQKSSFKSPLRDDKNPSFSVFDENRAWKDHGTGEGGDVVELVKVVLGGYSEAREWLKQQLGIQTPLPDRKPAIESLKEIKWPAPLVEGTSTTWWGFAKNRGISPTSVGIMAEAGLLRFAKINGEKCFAITDATNKAAEIRKIDRSLFGKTKAYPLSGVDKRWLLGSVWLRQACPKVGVFVVEGATDFLTAFDLYCRYRRGRVDGDSWVIVSLLGASCKMLDSECAELIRGRRVRIAPDTDDAGDAMLRHWKQLFHQLGCTVDSITQPRGTDLTDNAGEIAPPTLFSL
jgi:hypothetical protein